MNELNHQQQIVLIVASSMEVYSKDLTDGAMDIWVNILNKFDIDVIKHAFTVYLAMGKNGHFAPLPADIIKIITGGNEALSETAWTAVERAIRSTGGSPSVVFPDPIIHRVIFDLGGWTKTCEVSTRELPFLAIDFKKRYENYLNRGIIPQYPSRLTGSSELSCLEYGIEQQIVRLGREEDCKRVEMNGVTDDEVHAIAYSRPLDNLMISIVNKIDEKEAIDFQCQADSKLIEQS